MPGVWVISGAVVFVFPASVESMRVATTTLVGVPSAIETTAALDYLK